MMTTHTYPPETGEGPKRKTPIFSMDDIAASASKENRNFLDRPPSEDNHPVGRPTITLASLHDNPTPTVLQILSVLLHPMNFHDTEGPVYLMDTGKIRTHIPQHLNPHPMGGNAPPRNLTIPEAKPIPLLTLQTDTTKVTRMTTPNQAVLTNPENPEALTDPGNWVAPVGWRSWRSQWSRRSRRTWQQPPQRARFLAGIHESVARSFLH